MIGRVDLPVPSESVLHFTLRLSEKAYLTSLVFDAPEGAVKYSVEVDGRVVAELVTLDLLTRVCPVNRDVTEISIELANQTKTNTVVRCVIVYRLAMIAGFGLMFGLTPRRSSGRIDSPSPSSTCYIPDDNGLFVSGYRVLKLYLYTPDGDALEAQVEKYNEQSEKWSELVGASLSSGDYKVDKWNWLVFDDILTGRIRLAVRTGSNAPSYIDWEVEVS